MTRSEAAAFLKAHDNYVILTHRRPDGDTCGCAIALCRTLRRLGKSAVIYENPQFTARFAPYLAGLTRGGVLPDDTLISVDLAADNLLPFGAEDAPGHIRLAIDHHGSHSLTADCCLLEADRAACGEIIYGLLSELGVQPDRETADALYIAIATDTGCFRYSNVMGNTLRVAAELIDCGADIAPINKLFFDTKSFARLQLEARLTGSVELYANGAVGICTLPKAWLSELHISEDDIDSISGFARSIEGVEIGIMIREVEGGMGKISLRTSPNYDAAALCRELGGGGHAAAAGCSVAGGIDAARAAILDVLRRSGVQL